jgi:hypothetical protein
MYRSHSREKHLFSEAHLASYLQALKEEVKGEINQLSVSELAERKDEDIVDSFMGKYSLKTPQLEEDKIVVDAQEQDIRIRTPFDEVATVKGLHITVEVPYSGSERLFWLRPSTFSMSGTPSADVSSGKIVLNYETNEKNPEKIKGMWLGEIDGIKKHLGWVEQDVLGHQNSLEQFIKDVLVLRRKQAGESASLIGVLKGN